MRVPTPAERLLNAAALPTLERIRQDKLKAPPQLQPLLGFLEANLFDPELDANQLKKACGVRDHNLPMAFHHALSLPPYAYIEDCRLEVACRLLRDTELKIWQISQLLGYSSLQVFSRAFDRWSGLRPSIFRRQAAYKGEVERKCAADEDLPPQANEYLICLTTLRKAASGGLGSEEAEDLARQLSRLYPDSFHRAIELPPPPKSEPAKTQTLESREAWKLLQDRPRDEQLSLMKKQWQLASVELFEDLIEKSIYESRRDVRRGVEIASLALDCLEELRENLKETDYRKREVKGCAWLANAYRLAADLSQAESFLARGEMAFDASWAPEIHWDLKFIKSATRLSQRRLNEALHLADEVVALVPFLNQPSQKVRSWLHRAQTLAVLGRIQNAIRDLWEAHAHIEDVADKYLHASLYQSLCYCLAIAKRCQEAASYLPIARSIFQELGLERAYCYLEWTEGHIKYSQGSWKCAESHFQMARSGFYEADQVYLGAMVALDLATLYASQDRISETQDLGAEVVAIFDGLRVPHEALKAILLIRRGACASPTPLK